MGRKNITGQQILSSLFALPQTATYQKIFESLFRLTSSSGPIAWGWVWTSIGDPSRCRVTDYDRGPSVGQSTTPLGPLPGKTRRVRTTRWRMTGQRETRWPGALRPSLVRISIVLALFYSSDSRVPPPFPPSMAMASRGQPDGVLTGTISEERLQMVTTTAISLQVKQSIKGKTPHLY